MVYIIILNWRGAFDTIKCLSTVFNLQNSSFRVVICDNSSPDDSYNVIREWLLTNKEKNKFLEEHTLIEFTRAEAEQHVARPGEKAIYLVQTGENLGYAAGNNVGIRLAKNQSDMSHIWILNNDTLVDKDSLYFLLKRCNEDSKIGICGSKLIYHHDQSKLQGLGGTYNSWLCSTKHYAALAESSKVFDDIEVEKNIDYVIGASMLLTRSLIESVGLLCEDYFLYYEEIDLCLRAKPNFKIAVSTDSKIIHKEGASTGSGKSLLADYLFYRNKLRITRKFNRNKVPIVWISLFLTLANRIRRREVQKTLNLLKIIAFIEIPLRDLK